MTRATDTPLVSVIVPVYNGAAFLRPALDSILAQTYQPIEVIVMDDASTDETPAIVASYGSRVIHHRQSRNRGIYGNVNDALPMAKGELIATYHSDDVYLPTIVQREVEFLQKYPDAGAVFAADIFIDVGGREVGRLSLPDEIRGGKPLDYPTVFNALLRHRNRFLRCPSAMVRASVYRELNGYRDELFKNTSDVDMWLRIARAYPIGVLDEHLFMYRRGHGRSSERYHRVRVDQERGLHIMDLALEEGERSIAAPDALRAHEAHLAQDRLMRTVSYYIRGDLPSARRLLAQNDLRALTRSPRIQRVRMLVLYLVMQVATRVPRVPVLAEAFRRRWHSR